MCLVSLWGGLCRETLCRARLPTSLFAMTRYQALEIVCPNSGNVARDLAPPTEQGKVPEHWPLSSLLFCFHSPLKRLEERSIHINWGCKLKKRAFSGMKEGGSGFTCAYWKTQPVTSNHKPANSSKSHPSQGRALPCLQRNRYCGLTCTRPVPSPQMAQWMQQPSPCPPVFTTVLAGGLVLFPFNSQLRLREVKQFFLLDAQWLVEVRCELRLSDWTPSLRLLLQGLSEAVNYKSFTKLSSFSVTPALPLSMVTALPLGTIFPIFHTQAFE